MFGKSKRFILKNRPKKQKIINFYQAGQLSIQLSTEASTDIQPQ